MDNNKGQQTNDTTANSSCDVVVTNDHDRIISINHEEIYCSLVRLLESFAPAKATPTQEQLSLGHWRELDQDILKAYQLLGEGAEFVKVTSTKYTLMGKVCSSSSSETRSHDGLAFELLRGAEQIATGAFFLLQNCNGCGRSCQKLLREGVRATIASLASLVQVFLAKSNNDDTILTTANMKTGALWESCDALLLLPKGNRSAIRREILGWMRDCMETMQEFQQLLERQQNEDVGSRQIEQLSLNNNEDDRNNNNDALDEWHAFCTGGDEDCSYTAPEKGIVESCVALIKCSRGTLNLTLDACEVLGQIMSSSSSSSSSSDGQNEEQRKQKILQWIGKLSETSKEVGEGVTNLGMELYPSLQLDLLSSELDAHREVHLNLLNCIIEAADDEVLLTSFLSEIKVRASKLTQNVEVRYHQANNAILLLLN